MGCGPDNYPGSDSDGMGGRYIRDGDGHTSHGSRRWGHPANPREEHISSTQKDYIHTMIDIENSGDPLPTPRVFASVPTGAAGSSADGGVSTPITPATPVSEHEGVPASDHGSSVESYIPLPSNIVSSDDPTYGLRD